MNKMISKSAFVRKLTADAAAPGPLSDYAWLDGTPLDLTLRAPSQPSAPPPLSTAWVWAEGYLPFYRVPHLKEAFAKTFTSPHSPGAVYRPVFEAIEAAMRLPESEMPIDPRLIAEDGVHYRVLQFSLMLTLHLSIFLLKTWASPSLFQRCCSSLQGYSLVPRHAASVGGRRPGRRPRVGRPRVRPRDPHLRQRRARYF